MAAVNFARRVVMDRNLVLPIHFVGLFIEGTVGYSQRVGLFDRGDWQSGGLRRGGSRSGAGLWIRDVDVSLAGWSKCDVPRRGQNKKGW